jgi:exonuclease SbcD
MTKIAFVADLHVDDLGSKVNPETGLNARFEDGLRILGWVAQDAAARGCDVLVVGGDFTEQRHPAPWRVAKIAEALGAFPGPFVLARGNHDGLRAGRSIADVLGDMLGDAKGFSRPGIAWVKRTAICVLPYLDRHWLRSQPEFEGATDAQVFAALGEQFLAIARGLYAQAHDEHPDLDGCVLVVHQSLAGGQMTEQQQAFLGDMSLVVDTAALGAIGFDAVLAGHFHLHQTLGVDPLVVYAGSPQRVTFQEQDQTKGYLVVDTEKLPAFEFVETPARRFVTLTGNDIGDWPDITDAVVRMVDVDRDINTAAVRDELERKGGAFEITEIRLRPVEAAAAPTGLSESLTPAQALSSYFDGDVDAEVLVDRGVAILQEAA